MVIIGICGQKQHGKDTIADYLVKNYSFTKMSFAQPIKDMCRQLFSFNDEQLSGSLKETIDETWGFTPRQAFQFIGTDIFRDQFHKLSPTIGEDIWAFKLKFEMDKIINDHDREHKHICIADVRFDNEIDMLREYAKEKNVQCKIIHVHRQGVSNELIDLHCSEHQNIFNKVDSFIINTTLPLLYSNIDGIVKSII